MNPEARQFAAMLDYVYGKGASAALPWKKLGFVRSRRSGRLKLVRMGASAFATVKESGAIALSLDCAMYLRRSEVFLESCVTAADEAVEFVRKGRTLFCRHVLGAGKNVRRGMDVAILDSRGDVVGCGKAVVPSGYMTSFKHGVAVRVREGADTKL